MNLNNKSIKIAVIGGGNIGTQFACKCASKGYTVNVYTSKPDLFDEKLVKLYESTCVKYERIKTRYLFPSGTSNYGKWIIKRKCFTEISPLLFENEKFMCPTDYDSYLRAAYGDYMKLPPKNKRGNQHRIIRI